MRAALRNGAPDPLAQTVSRAVKNGDAAKLRKLLDAGAPLDTPDETGMTPLHLVSLMGDVVVAKVLFAYNPDVNALTTEPDQHNVRDQTPLHLAASQGHIALMRRLLLAGANPELLDSVGRTPILTAARFSQDDAVCLLLQHETDDDEMALEDFRLPDYSDRSILHIAALEGHYDLVVALCMRGVDVNSKDSVGMTPLHEAAWHGHSEICKVLMSKGMDPDVTNDEGSTPLHYAAENGHLETVRVLLDKGADQTLCDRWRRSPMDLADSNKRYDVRLLLKEHVGTPLGILNKVPPGSLTPGSSSMTPKTPVPKLQIRRQTRKWRGDKPAIYKTIGSYLMTPRHALGGQIAATYRDYGVGFTFDCSVFKFMTWAWS